MPVPKKNPRKAPRADLAESHPFLPEKASSARNAPRMVPRMIPTGGMNIPANKPTSAPLPAAFVPPVSLVNHAGTR